MTKIKLTRWEGNPLVKPIESETCWWESRCVLNPGAIVKDGKIYLLYRAMGSLYYSHFGLAILKDPFTIEKRLSLPVLEPEHNNDLERFGIEDPRIVYLESQYWIVYNAASVYSCLKGKPEDFDSMIIPWKLRCSLLSTQDFEKFTRYGVILPDIDSKDGTLFPEKINGRYLLLHRLFPDIWLSTSAKIDQFPQGQILAQVRAGEWDSERIGAGAPPLKTPLGWLEFYHGVSRLTNGSLRYHLGILLLDLADPSNILYRSQEPIFSPEKDYEELGYTNQVVFTCGAVEWEEKYYLFYGAADTCIGVAFINKKELLNFLARKINQ